MGSRSAKPSSPLTQTIVPPSEPVTPPTTSSQQLAPCRINAPTVSHAEWDECMRQSILTIGTTTVTAIAFGLMLPAANTLLLLGTGAGVLWSVKRCRTLMRDGILSPEQAKALDHKKRMEREEKKRQRKMEKEARQRAAAEQKLLEKQKKAGNKKSGSNDCCTKLKKALEQKGVNVDDLSCEKLSHKNEGQFKAGNTLATGSHSANDLLPQGHTLQEDQPINLGGSISRVSYIEEKGESPRIVKDKLELGNPRELKSSGVDKYAKKVVKRSDTDTYSTVKLFAPYSRYLSDSVVLTCDSKECTCNLNKDNMNCTCDPKQLFYGESQQYTLATDAENEDPPAQEEDPENFIVQQVTSEVKDMAEQKRNSEIPILAESAGDSNTDVLEHPVKEEDQISAQEPEEDEEEVEVILSPAFDSIESLDHDSSIELILEDHEDLDINIEESQDGVDVVEVIKNEIGEEIKHEIEQLKHEVEVVFAETYKSESWPFSFSLPSLDKFSKKKNNSFKWPPLTSSIIVKPKKEPTCKCSDGLGTTEDNGNALNECTCGSSKDECTRT